MNKNIVSESRYWMQEQAPAGNYFDSIGYDSSRTLAEVTKDFRRTAKAWGAGSGRKFRLIVRTDAVIL